MYCTFKIENLILIKSILFICRLKKWVSNEDWQRKCFLQNSVNLKSADLIAVSKQNKFSDITTNDTAQSLKPYTLSLYKIEHFNL